jgi:predicted TIM-barrel fold metal-dependent hydrolase
MGGGPEAAWLSAQRQHQDFGADRVRSIPDARKLARGCAGIESSGVDRSMFGSDFPVGRLWTSFDSIFDGFKSIVRDFSDAQQSTLFHDNARRVYRIDAL